MTFERMTEKFIRDNGFPDSCNAVVVTGSDPGPVYTARVEVMFFTNAAPMIIHAGYNSNEDISSVDATVRDLPGTVDVFAYERVGNQGRIVGDPVFRTCAITGDLCRFYRHSCGVDMIVSFRPGEWRRVLTGLYNAKDSETRAVLNDLNVSGIDLLRAASKKASSEYRLRKSSLPHLRDALGVALSVVMLSGKPDLTPDGFIVYRKGADK